MIASPTLFAALAHTLGPGPGFGCDRGLGLGHTFGLVHTFGLGHMLGIGLVAVSSNRGAAYDLVLLAHVLAAFVAFAVVGVAGVSALQVRRPGEPSETVARYYRPGVNWVGRTLFIVPVLGFLLIAMSHGAWSFSDGWVSIGLVLWAAAACAAEMVLWPAERRLQQLVSDDPTGHEARRGLCLQVAGVSAGLLALFVVVTVVMVAKP